MKIIKLLTVLLCLFCNAYSNVVSPKIYISEIFIETSVSWTIELAFPDDPTIIAFDSIIIENKSGKVKVTNYTLTDTTTPGSVSTYLALVTNADVSGMLEFDRENDFIKVYSYILEGVNFDYVAFGSYPGSFFPDFKPGYSIACRAPDEFSLDKIPTLGSSNNEEGMLGTLQGHLLDIEQTRLAYTDVVVLPNVTTDGNGYFNVHLLSRSYFIVDTVISPTQTLVFRADTINIMPDSVTNKDIIIMSTHSHSGIIEYREPKNNPHMYFMNYPNPYRDMTVFYFVLPKINHYNRVTFQIYDNTGRLFTSVDLPDNKGVVVIPSNMLGNVKAGIYYYTLLFDGIPSGHLNSMVKLP